MPLVGTRAVNAFDNGPLVTEIGAEPWLLPGCGILQIMYEIDADAMTCPSHFTSMAGASPPPLSQVSKLTARPLVNPSSPGSP